MPSIRILIADEHVIFCRGLRHACENEGGFEVLAEARDGRSLVEMARRLRPDIVLMDAHLPLMDGTQVIRTITKQDPNLGVIVLCRKDACMFERAIRAGTRGYLLKDVNERVLIRAIRAVHRGEVVIDPYATAKMLNMLRGTHRNGNTPQANRPGRTDPLSDREMEVLRLVAQGLDNQAIAGQLHVMQKTVSNYLSSLYRKLDVNNRTQAALHALRQGWATLDAGI
ncbi:MAG: response regulator transcription factor [Chloroflexi bacterium]|nr:response regulator transcription factor [Chloroflexota bacterium]